MNPSGKPSPPKITGNRSTNWYANCSKVQFLTSVSTPNRTIEYAYNEEGTLKSVTTPQGTTTYSYNSQTGNLERVTFPNSTVETRTYDALGRLDVLKTAKVDPNTGAEVEVISSFDYDSDGVGNRLEVKEENGRRVEYKYDELNRVVQEKIIDPVNGDRTIDYTYDAVGNLEEKRDSVAGVTDYTYNALNQLMSSTVGGVTTIYAYDDNGSLISRTTGSTSITYDWQNNGENRLVGVTINDGTQTTAIEYEYNEKGVRTGKKVNGVETRYLIDELQPYAQVVEEYDALGNLVASYTYGLDLIAQLRGGVSSFYHADGLGSTRALSDGSGNVTDTYTYDAYGNLIGSTGSTLNPYLFAGEWRDGETGLDYLRARYYDAALGRFVSRDAYAGSLNDPMSLHKYQYAHANPVANTDPSGYFSVGEILGGLAVGSVLSGLSFTTGAAVGTVAAGGSVWDGVALYDQFFAGLMDAITFGTSTQVRRLIHGEKATNNHKGLYFNLGRLGGAVTSMWIGSYAAAFNGLQSAPWWAKAALGYDLFGAGVGTHEVLKDGLNWLDILYFIPLLLGLSSSLGLEISLNLSRISFGPKGIFKLNPGPGKAAFYIEDDILGVGLTGADKEAARYARRINPKNDYFDLALHGDEQGKFVIQLDNPPAGIGNIQVDEFGNQWLAINHRWVARFIKSQGYRKGQPVRLIACNSGLCTGAAQDLANKLGADVLAPNVPVLILPTGNLRLVGSQGKWILYKPGR
ncbi:MAG: RHS repeat-associated core domain-containing protein [Desertifilum sp.]|nr:RHS repeat-associated core domain-containing protein [Desertifilum sp.]